MEFSKEIIDLHIHSNASDGSYTPQEIVKMALDKKISAISITDHDTIQGSKIALSEGIPPSIDFVTGVEISTDVPSVCTASSSLHMLGYFIKLDNPLLNSTLDALQTARVERTPQMLDRLKLSGIIISHEEVQDTIGESQPGRPHLAKVLLKKGIVRSFQEAFDRFLGKGKPAYVEKYKLSAEKAIEIIIGAGGIPVLAHPFLLQLKNNDELEQLILHLKKCGLEGIEAIYPEHTPENVSLYKKIASKYNLLVTGGTDFHGNYKPEIQIGVGKGDLKVPYKLYEIMLERKAEKEKSVIDSIENKENEENLKTLEKKLKYNFKNISNLREALQHSSYVNEHPDSKMNDNERLEFLGDAVLNLVIGHLLMDWFPEVNEGDLSRMRATIVNEKKLASVAKQINISEHLLLGKGEIQTNGRQKQSILADTVEAIIASVYLDNGFDSAFNFVKTHFSSLLLKAKSQDHKSELQEYAQGKLKIIPKYEIVQETGPDHKKIFEVKLSVGELLISKGSGRSKKIAEQHAAREALKTLKISQSQVQ